MRVGYWVVTKADWRAGKREILRALTTVERMVTLTALTTVVKKVDLRASIQHYEQLRLRSF